MFKNRSPLKLAGQDFGIKEHLDLLESLTSITPKSLNAAFLVNSGAEAVENSIKICMHQRPGTKFGISFEGAFHGRTLGALSLTNSKSAHKKNYMTLPMRRLPFSDSAHESLQRIINQEGSPENVGFVILEHIQGESGYNVSSKSMVKKVRKLCNDYSIPYIADEVQSGIGRTGKWWAFDHFNIIPDVFSSAKALQVGACISSSNFFPKDPGAISSTWGGGSLIDLTTGLQIINSIKKNNLLSHVSKMGIYLRRMLNDLPQVSNVRGLGLMTAFDVDSNEHRNNLITECVKQGLVVLGCGTKGVRLIPPFIVTSKEIDEAIDVLERSIKKCYSSGFKHSGKICDYLSCSEHPS